MTNDYVKPLVRGLHSVLRIFSKGVLVVGVFVTVITLFIGIGSRDIIEKPSPESRLADIRKKLYEKASSTDMGTNPLDKLSQQITSRVMCSFNGELCDPDPNSEKNNFSKSMMGQAGLLVIAPITNPPASFVHYAYDGLDNVGFIPKAVAAEGIGFAGIQPLANIWKVFRNIAYFILVLVLIAVGFMIMFRMKLNPQTVIGIENALPRIVLALLFITFSFPIAGLIIDLMYVFMALLILAIGPLAGIPATEIFSKFVNSSPSSIPTLILGKGFFGIPGIGGTSGFYQVFFALPRELMMIFGVGFYVVWQVIAASVGVFYLFPFFINSIGINAKDAVDVDTHIQPGGIGITFDGIVRALGGSVINTILLIASIGFGMLFLRLIIGAIIFFTVIVISFRIFFMLLSAYIKIISLIILSPLILMFEALPGKATFTSWAKSLFAELLTFPILVAIFIIGSIIIETAGGSNLIRMPFLNDTIPGFGLNTQSLVLLMGFTVLFMTPDLVMFFKKMVSPKGLNLPSAGIGIFFGGGVSAVDTGLTKIGTYSHAFSGISHLKGNKIVQRIFKGFGGGGKGGSHQPGA